MHSITECVPMWSVGLIFCLSRKARLSYVAIFSFLFFFSGESVLKQYQLFFLQRFLFGVSVVRNSSF